MFGNGNYVQDWMANDQGIVTPGETTENIKIQAGKTMQAVASSTATYTHNLRADGTVYKISNVQVKYADGTSETTTNYTPAEKGTIHLTTDTGWYVTLDDTADYNFKTGEYIAGKTLWTSGVDSVTATGPSPDGSVDLEMAPDRTDPAGRHSVTGLASPVTVTSGTYRYGDKFGFSGTIKEVTALGTGTGEVRLDFVSPSVPTGIASVVVPKPRTFSYQVGDTYNGVLKIYRIHNIGPNATVKAKNGQSATGVHFNGLDVTSEHTVAICKGVHSDGTVKIVHRTSGWSFNGKEVENATIQTTDGQSMTGMIGKAYRQDDLFSPPLATLFTVYDTQGREHKVTLNFTRIPSEDNAWELSVGRGASSDTVVESDFSQSNIGLSSTKLVFDEKGRYKSGDGTVKLTYTSPNGAEDSRTITLNLAALTQYAGSSTIRGVADGNASGALKSVQVDSSGVITGTYTNGVMRKEAQVAVAQFNNASGLTKAGGNLYQESNNSGKGTVHTATDIGATITPSALEMSNVDIANEFSDMIITQRGFQSNSKIITVDDEMLETVIGMKR